MIQATVVENAPIDTAIPRGGVDESDSPPGGRWTIEVDHALAAQAVEGGTVVRWDRRSNGAQMFGFYQGFTPIQFNQLVADHSLTHPMLSFFQIVLPEKSSHARRKDALYTTPLKNSRSFEGGGRC